MIGPKSQNDAPSCLTKAAREALYDRQGGLCPWCGFGLRSELAGDMAAHHRRLRSHGGTWDLANLVGLHGGCHNVQPGSVHQEPKRAYRLGFMIRTRLLTPAQIPIYARDQQVWLLADGDGYQRCGYSEASELIAIVGGLPGDGTIF